MRANRRWSGKPSTPLGKVMMRSSSTDTRPNRELTISMCANSVHAPRTQSCEIRLPAGSHARHSFDSRGRRPQSPADPSRETPLARLFDTLVCPSLTVAQMRRDHRAYLARFLFRLLILSKQSTLHLLQQAACHFVFRWEPDA